MIIYFIIKAMQKRQQALTENISLILIASLIGVLAGFGAFILKKAIEFVHNLLWNGKPFLAINSYFSFWTIVLIPAAGFLFTVLISRYIFSEEESHGISHIIESIFFRNGKISAKIFFSKLTTSAITIGSGGSVGKEDPVIQMGSSIGSVIGQIFKAGEGKLRTLVACGASGGLAAAFNAPMAGAMFAVEIILGDFGIKGFMPIIVSSVMGVFTSHYLEGDFASFKLPSYEIKSPVEFFYYFLLGTLTAVVSIIFIHTLYFMRDRFGENRIPFLLKALMGGATVGIIGYFMPYVFGMGFFSIQLALENKLEITILLILIFAKIISTSITLSSGGSGGVFVPSLFLGAMSGLFLGKIIAFFDTSINPSAYSIVGMAGGIAGATHAPITAILLVFELTKDYRIILPLMFTAVVSSTISSSIFEYSIYTLDLKLKDIILRQGHEVNILQSIKVKELLSKNCITLPPDKKFPEILKMVLKGGAYYFHVVDEKSNYIGTFTLKEMKEPLMQRDLFMDLIVAEDISNPFTTLSPESSLEEAMQIFSEIDDDELPVVNEDGKFLGVISRKDVIKVYNNELRKREVTERLLTRLKFAPEKTVFQVTENYLISEIKAPDEFYGKSLRELNLRANYGLEVLMIKKTSKKESFIFPNPDYIIKDGDILLIGAEKDALERFKKLYGI